MFAKLNKQKQPQCIYKNETKIINNNNNTYTNYNNNSITTNNNNNDNINNNNNNKSINSSNILLSEMNSNIKYPILLDILNLNKSIVYFQILPYFFGTNGYVEVPKAELPFVVPLVLDKYLLRQHPRYGLRSQKTIARGYITNNKKCLL